MTAIIAIVSLFIGDLGELQVKIIATSFTISAASITSMSCAAFIEKYKLTTLGLFGIFLSVVSAIFIITALWATTLFENSLYWKTTISLTVLAVAFAHAFLLFYPNLSDKYRWIKTSSAIAISILSIQIIVAAIFEIGNEYYYRFLAVTAIIVGLHTLIIPILIRLNRAAEQATELLILENVDGTVYKDSSGKMYSVEEISSPDEEPTSEE